MKLTIESLENGRIGITLNLNGKDYTEIWEEKEFGYETINKSIINQIERIGVYCDETGIETLLCNIDVGVFKEISDDESDWKVKIEGC